MTWKILLRHVTLMVAMLLAAFSLTLHAQNTGASAPSVALQKSFGEYLTAHAEAPEDYVVGKFRDHDIVFLGEQHHIQENLDFAQRLIPKLYASGIYNMGWEFADSEDQPAIDRLLYAPEWDEAGAEQILWKCYNLPWVSTGYAGILHAAWQLNHSLKAEQRRFRIVGVNLQSRLTSRSQLLPGEVPTEHRVRSRVLGLNDFDAVNIHWAQVISQEFIAKREKALIYCGSGHTWTRFFFQRQIDSALTAGNLIYDYIGDRTMRLVLHGDLQGGKDFEQTVESLMRSTGDAHRRTAFDIRGGPLVDLPVHIRGYLYASDPGHQLTAGDVWDGYVYLGPQSEWQNDKFIASFITPQNFPRLKESWELFSRTEKVHTLEDLVRVVKKQTEWIGTAP